MNPNNITPKPSLSSSPTCIASPLFTNRKLHHHRSSSSTTTGGKRKLTLEEFIELIPTVIRNKPKKQGKTDPVENLFRRLEVTQEDTSAYTFITEEKNYTRNLISTDDETYTLLLLCWNPNKSSPIHDHPCDGCWMRVLQGSINEKRYKINGSTTTTTTTTTNKELICTKDSTFQEGEIAFIDDHLGLHKVGNQGKELAISMHLYSPPFGKCRIWMDEKNGENSCISRMHNYSEFGSLVVE